MRRLLLKVALWLMRRRYAGQVMYRLSSLQGTPLVRGKGKIISTGASLAANGQPVGLYLRYLEEGKQLARSVKVDWSRVSWDKHLKAWAFYD